MRYVMVIVVSMGMAACGGGDGGCKPPCSGEQVCCDFSPPKCVSPERCK